MQQAMAAADPPIAPPPTTDAAPTFTEEDRGFMALAMDEVSHTITTRSIDPVDRPTASL
jgi:hypothetical protein